MFLFCFVLKKMNQVKAISTREFVDSSRLRTIRDCYSEKEESRIERIYYGKICEFIQVRIGCAMRRQTFCFIIGRFCLGHCFHKSS